MELSKQLKGINMKVLAGQDKDYALFVKALFKEFPDFQQTLMHAAVGISGEAGELLDACKQPWVYNKPLNRANVIEEMGDIFFYYTKLCELIGVSLEEIIFYNMDKLNKRYSEGKYTDKAAQERADKNLSYKLQELPLVAPEDGQVLYAVGSSVPQKQTKPLPSDNNLPKTAEEALRFAVQCYERGEHVNPTLLLEHVKLFLKNIPFVNTK